MRNPPYRQTRPRVSGGNLTLVTRMHDGNSLPSVSQSGESRANPGQTTKEHASSSAIAPDICVPSQPSEPCLCSRAINLHQGDWTSSVIPITKELTYEPMHFPSWDTSPSGGTCAQYQSSGENMETAWSMGSVSPEEHNQLMLDRELFASEPISDWFSNLERRVLPIVDVTVMFESGHPAGWIARLYRLIARLHYSYFPEQPTVFGHRSQSSYQACTGPAEHLPDLVLPFSPTMNLAVVCTEHRSPGNFINKANSLTVDRNCYMSLPTSSTSDFFVSSADQILCLFCRLIIVRISRVPELVAGIAMRSVLLHGQVGGISGQHGVDSTDQMHSLTSRRDGQSR
nr:hypothetical protein Iba_chr14cCG7220 [Ipomoea batatas]